MIAAAVRLQVSQMLAGGMLRETVFDWPTLCRLANDSVLHRVYPTRPGILLCPGCLVVLANILTDIALRRICTRIAAAWRRRATG